MKYFEMHEEVYKSLDEKGKISWDGESDPTKLYSQEINIALKKMLDQHFPDKQNKFSLDLGTGTGTVALYLAQQGFKSKGIDVSETAISIASKNKLSLGLGSVEFEVQDLCQLKADKKFDLIIDSSFLHCIVHEEERQNIYKSVRTSLTTEGYFFVHTMIQTRDMSKMLEASHIHLSGEILYSTGPDHWEMNWEEYKGHRVFPHRRIIAEENLLKEMSQNMFSVVSSEIIEREGWPSVFVGWLRAI